MKGLGVSLLLLAFFAPPGGRETVSNAPAAGPPVAPTNPAPQSRPSGTNPPAGPASTTGAAASPAKSYSDTPRWVANGIATVNMLLACYLAYYTHSTRRKERKDDVNRSVAVFWVQDLILKPNMEALQQFFQVHEEALSQAHGRKEKSRDLRKQARDRITSFKAEYHNIRRKIIDPLMLVSPRFQTVRDTFLDFEDLVTNFYAQIPGVADDPKGSAKPSPAVQFRDLRDRLITELHEAQKALVTSGR